MDLITKSIDGLEKLMGHSPHPAIVAVPLGAFTASVASDAMAVATGRERFDQAAEISMAVGLVGTVAAAATGLRDYGKIPRTRQPNHRIATAHGLGNLAVGALFATSYALRVGSRRRGDRPSGAARMLALAGAGLSLYTGWLGGKLVEELGEAVHPVMERMAAQEALGATGKVRPEGLTAATGAIPSGV
jgi:uncharacterized membrane protein